MLHVKPLIKDQASPNSVARGLGPKQLVSVCTKRTTDDVPLRAATSPGDRIHCKLQANPPVLSGKACSPCSGIPPPFPGVFLASRGLLESFHGLLVVSLQSRVSWLSWSCWCPSGRGRHCRRTFSLFEDRRWHNEFLRRAR